MGNAGRKVKKLLKISVIGLLLTVGVSRIISEKGIHLAENYKLAVGDMEKAEAAVEGAVTVTSHKKFVNAVYDMALNRRTSGTFYYKGDYNDIFDGDINALLNEVCAIDDKSTSDDADYLANSISSINVGTSYNYTSTKIIDSTISIKIRYLETAAQLQAVNEKVAEVLGSLGVKGKSNYQKVKLIHDYIVNNTRYVSSANAHTAYGALLEGKAVCQGYSQLAYKMLTDAGVKCYFISGQANNGSRTEDHAWNLVKAGKKWYYLDVTWDDPTGGEDRLRYDYFLVGSRKFDQDHIASSEFKKITAKASKSDHKKNGTW